MTITTLNELSFSITIKLLLPSNHPVDDSHSCAAYCLFNLLNTSAAPHDLIGVVHSVTR